MTYGHDSHVVPPLFEAYAAALLEKRGFEVDVLDGQVRNFDHSQLLEEVKTRHPHILVSRISLPSYREDLNLLADIKEILPNVISVAWGTLCVIEPQRVLRNSGLNVTIEGELEFTVLEVVERFERGDSLRDVKGISFKQNGNIVSNVQRPLAKDLDVLPLPAYHLLDMNKYVIKETRFFPETANEKGIARFFSVHSSRGCPFNCVYCPYPLAFGRVWRGLSPRRTVDEIEHLVNTYGVQGIWFRDQTFSMNIKRAIAICDEILERGLAVPWTCETRADRLPRNLVRTMKRAGCVRVSIGVETGDPQQLSSMGKRGYSIRTIENAFRITREEGLLRKAFVLVGLPGESWKTIQNTRKLLERIRPDTLTVDIVTPYPGTSLYEMAERNNWIITKDWSKYTTVDPIMSLDGFTDKDMKSARRYLLDQARIKGKTDRIISAIREHRLHDATREFEIVIRDFPNNIWRVYNLVRSKLKQITI
jgi:radical SAM superfamily enzyme YgiQ (UPF0313 family)